MIVLKHAGIFEDQCHGLAQPRTQGVAPAKIAFEGSPPVRIKSHGPEGAGMHTHLAADTRIIIDNGTHLVRISGDGFPGACRRTGSLFTMLAGKGKVAAVITKV